MSTSLPSDPTEPRFRSLVDRLGAIVWEAVPGDRPGEAAFTFVSEGAELLLGYPAERWTGDPRFWASILHPEDAPRATTEMAAAAAERRGADFEYRCMARDGRAVWVRSIVHADLAEDDTILLRGVMVDVTERREAEQRLVRLQQLTDALSGLLDDREVAGIVASQGRAAVDATAVAVFLRRGDELELSGYDGYSEQTLRDFCRFSLDRDIPAAETTRTGRPIVLDAEALEARYPAVAGWRRLAGDGQFVSMPLTVEGQTLGSLAIRMPGARALGRGDQVVLEVLSRSCAQAVQRARHVAAEREANAVLDTIITTAPEGFALFDTDLRYVRVNDAMAAINGIPVADHVGRTLRELLPGVPESGVERHLRRVLETGEPAVDVEVSGFTPAKPGQQSTWVASYYPVRGAAGEVAYLGAFVLDITARKRAEQRAKVLAELGAILDEVVGVAERLGRLVDALVPEVADACTVSLRGGEGVLDRVAIRHVDREAEHHLEGMTVPRRGTEKTRVMPDIADADLDAYGFGPEAQEVRRRVGIRSAVTVPMVVRGRHVGMLALASLRPDAFAPDDVALAEEVARRAALAVDNAQLYESERIARDRTARQYAVAAALADALTAEDVAAAILAEIVPAVGADGATVWQLSEDEMAVERIGALGFAAAALAGHERYALRESRPVADAIRARQPLWLSTRADLTAAYPRFADGFAAAGIESAAVVPVLSAGRAVGGIWLSSKRPQAFDAEDRALTAALAAQAAQALERARLFESERRVSVTLQRSLLPAGLPDVDGIQVAVRYVPAAGLEAGGDFYEALPLPGGGIAFAVGDVVGRGAKAAAAMGQLRSALRAFALVGESPAEILAHLSAFADMVDGAMASTAIVARLRPDTGELRYACAGHPWPLVVHPEGRAEYLKDGRGVPLGCVGDPVFEESVTHLEPGSTIVLYTDGLTERRGTDVAQVQERLRLAAEATAGAPLGELLDRAVAGTGQAAPVDDVALVAVRLTGVAGPPLPPLKLRFPADTREVPAARAAMREWFAGATGDRAATGDLLLAAGEAVANAVEHSSGDEVHLQVAMDEPGVVAVTVRDTGRWKAQAFETHRGRGFGLMRALVDEIGVERGDGGTTVRLRRRVADRTSGGPPAAPGGEGCTMDVEDGVARVRGDLDLSCAPEIGERLLRERPHIVDLTEVGYLDSAGARLLIEASGKLGGRLTVIAPPGGAPRRALDLSGLGTLLDLRDA